MFVEVIRNQIPGNLGDARAILPACAPAFNGCELYSVSMFMGIKLVYNEINTSPQNLPFQRSKKMILFILYEFVSNHQKGASGGNISNYLLIEKLRHHRKVGIIAPNITKELEVELKAKGILVITENIKSKTPFKRFKKRQWLKKTIHEITSQPTTLTPNIDIVVSSNGTCDLTSAFQKETTEVFILCRAFEDFFNHNSYYPLKEKAKRLLIKLISEKKISSAYKSANKIITNSDFMKNFIQHHYPNANISVLFPPIDITIKNYKTPPPQPIVGIINPSSRKGEDIFISLAKHYPSFKFKYFSQSDKNYTFENIEYAGWLSDREVLFSNVDILIAPSVWSEPFGRVSVEAIRSGIPVLVSNVGGLPETVDPAFVVHSQSFESWTKKIHWLINNPAEVESAWFSSIIRSKKFEQNSHDESALKIFNPNSKLKNTNESTT